jgi:hypothetical protein
MAPHTWIKSPVGLEFTGEFFLVSSTKDEIVTLKKIKYDGSRIEDFAQSFSSQGEVYIAISKGLGDFKDGYIYVNSVDKIIEISPDGSRISEFATPLPGNSVMYLAFDGEGFWDNNLIAVNGNGDVWEIDSDGATSFVASLGNDMFPESIVVAPADFGSLAGHILISEEWGNKISAISPTSDHKVSVLASFPDEPLERLIFVLPGSDLFINKYEENLMFKVSHVQLRDYVDSLLVISEGEYGAPASIYAITPSEESSDEFIITTIEKDIIGPHFEGAVFVDAQVLGDQFWYYVLAGIIAIVSTIAAVFFIIRLRSK